LLGLVSEAKWAVFPRLARLAPKLAILTHEPESTRAFWEVLRPGAIVIDGGSNRGGYSILGSLGVGPAGRVFAFEPEPSNFERLRRILRDFPNVVPVPKAIGGEVGAAALKLDTFHAGHSLVRDVGLGKSVSVPVTTVDAFVAENRLPGVDVLKLDIEGAELDAVRGMAKLLCGERRPIILIEVHPPLTPEQLLAALDEHGYEGRLLDAPLTGNVHEVPVHLLARPRR
jgi:FkbM family methyltransferase